MRPPHRCTRWNIPTRPEGLEGYPWGHPTQQSEVDSTQRSLLCRRVSCVPAASVAADANDMATIAPGHYCTCAPWPLLNLATTAPVHHGRYCTWPLLHLAATAHVHPGRYCTCAPTAPGRYRNCAPWPLLHLAATAPGATQISSKLHLLGPLTYRSALYTKQMLSGSLEKPCSNNNCIECPISDVHGEAILRSHTIKHVCTDQSAHVSV
jgi:hypothetical protein